MPIEVATLTPDREAQYAELVAHAPGALVYASLEYRAFLRDALPKAEDCYLVAVTEGRVVGALPAFSLAGPHGVVVNSLPYYGSHGDVVTAPDVADRDAVERELLNGLAELAKARAADAVMLVSNPLRRSEEGLLRSGMLRRVDDRIGQVSRLAPAATRETAIEAVLRACHQKTRNLVRKGLRAGFTIEVSDDPADWRSLHEHHALGMARIGGRAKSWAAFAALHRQLLPGGLVRCYVARRDGAFAGGLLLLRHRDRIEYFTPAAVVAFKSEQVLSALIAEAMAESAVAGYRVWNWGGTWRSQDGVYHFKSGWGAEDSVYGYFGALRSPELAALGRDEILAAYPDFYVRPFDAGASADGRSVA